MTDSTTTQQQGPDSPIERPSWRFSGRRGTPVHLREQTPATLPREIRQVITQMSRERTSAGSTATQPTSSSARPDVSFTAPDRTGSAQNPPVAAAPMPIERRDRSRPKPDAVTSSPIITSSPESSEPVNAASDLPSSATAAAREPESLAEQPKPTDRKRRSKAKARAKARARAKAKSQSRVLAHDRDVPVTEPVAVEPIVTEPTTTEPAATEPVVAEPIVATDTSANVGDSLPDDVFAVIESPVEAGSEDGTPTVPDPTIGVESAQQAAWELGRLPILLEPLEAPQVASHEAGPQDAELVDIPSIRFPEPDASPAASPLRERPRPAHRPVVLRPIDWLPVGPDPAPSPLFTSDPEDRVTPPSIEQLSTTRARVRASGTRHDDRAPAVRAAEARHQVDRRRQDLNRLVGSLTGLGTGCGHDRATDA
jgi:hypothetical protein